MEDVRRFARITFRWVEIQPPGADKVLIVITSLGAASRLPRCEKGDMLFGPP